MHELFEPFNRLVTEGSSIEGTGYITKRLVETMGGLIGVSSESGKGSCFWFELLRADTHTPSIPPSEQITTMELKLLMMSQRTLLYIEDNPANMSLVRAILERFGDVKMYEAGTAEEGIEMAQQHQPDLILMDINLPGMNGFEAMQQLKLHDATRHIPVLGLSANAMSKDIERGKAAGFYDYVTKPIDVNHFLTVLDELYTKIETT